jgi:hypothetical protein
MQCESLRLSWDHLADVEMHFEVFDRFTIISFFRASLSPSVGGSISHFLPVLSRIV